MHCPFCNLEDTQVKDSRTASDGSTVKRRRFCSVCNAKFITFERREVSLVSVIKSDNRLQPFDFTKLRRSLDIATRKRGITNEQAEIIISRILLYLDKSGETVVCSNVIGKLVMQELVKIDKVSYVRYASVYKDFTEIKDFEKFIKNNKLVNNG